jgi:hypothetical protein
MRLPRHNIFEIFQSLRPHSQLKVQRALKLMAQETRLSELLAKLQLEKLKDVLGEMVSFFFSFAFFCGLSHWATAIEQSHQIM